ncbi:Asp-tRNA(Asn)/Glu-tRNA(Gln) amidotransferase subunit GatC [Leptospira wolffii]|uniref:Aspartyl/glutamyl-tRNA(Asn/Gln) amidotransferase subunit C n=1 Tax=Leptospira wolffii TaxID=409998 RepID=A0ABV5BLW0_9LEPT|nr:Asp-tRNA(Asn)/Glu-tRNA(Gln) amidotransferase subunit GatC [Leptospira wolffii]EPG66586.1 aspartyl/glutamyl-tRNA(Asn/Gln) amidotransferase, C subunit [Leptospira wolffii serovar Khorat str. Khorat-H2]TGL49974.1 Asp-tRNA(Asn)/Glu-tRNA(Gln) amidotransferase subunit GatC [Leptospira wolffii]
MNLNEESLQKIAELSRLKIDPKDIQAFLSDFNKVLNYVDTITELDVSSITEEELYPNEGNVLRKDVVVEGLSRQQIESFAPSFQNGYFVVPKVIET